MLKLQHPEDCCGCGACAAICPHNAITLQADNEGFVYPVVNDQACVNCGVCVTSCPIMTTARGRLGFIPDSYAAKNTNESIRQHSSSGGVFSVLAEYVIRQRGIVFGAALNDDLVVEHQFTDTLAGLERFRGSKYVQSATAHCYPLIKEFLLSNRVVLFSGTPCQIAGLKSFLKKDYQNLICIDIVCHGVPSPSVWKSYLMHIQSNASSKVCAASFRDKTHGWHNFSMKLVLENGKTLIYPNSNDAYMRAFLANYDLRPSCYRCAFKEHNSGADLSLADFWGIEHILPDFDDDQGTSLIIIGTPKGHQLLQNVAKQIHTIPVNYDDALKYNPAIVRSVVYPKERKHYIRDSSKYNFPTLTNYYFSRKFIWRIKRKLKYLLEK